MREKETEGGREGHLAAAAAVRPSQCVRGWLPTRWLVGILSPACNHSNSARGEENQSLPAAAVRDFPSFLALLPSSSLPSLPLTLPYLPSPFLTSPQLTAPLLSCVPRPLLLTSTLPSSLPLLLLLFISLQFSPLLFSFPSVTSSLLMSPLFSSPSITAPRLSSFPFCSILFSSYLPSPSHFLPSRHLYFPLLVVLCQSPSLITCCSSNVNSWYGQFPAEEGETLSAFLYLNKTHSNDGKPH